MKKQILGVMCAAALLLQGTALLPVSASDAAIVDSGINYTESVEYDLGSCDSGYTSCPWIIAKPGKNWSTSICKYSLLLIGIGGYSSGMNTDGVDYEFDEIFFTSLENTLQSARSNGVTVGLRFRYDDNGTTNPEPAEFSMVLRHIEQIGESGLLTEYEDVISFVETGMVGSWGEQWGGKYTSLEHKAQVLDAFLNITPDTIPVTVRTPNTFRQWLSDYCGITTTAEDMSYTIEDPVLAAKAARVGLYNDGYMGSDSDLGTYSNRAGETAWLHEAPSYGGEFSGADEWRMKYTTWQPEYALPEMYYTNLLRINSNMYRTKNASQSFDTMEEAEARLAEIRALYEDCGLGDFNEEPSIAASDNEDGTCTYVASWKWMGYDAFTFDAELDAKLGVDCDNSAFYGQTVWQFMRAHLGYRFVLRSSKLSESSEPGGSLAMEFSVENTGFSETPKDKEIEILLTNGTIVYTYTTDLNARDWASATLNTETLDLTLPETMPGGEWDVYMRISEHNEDAVYDDAFCTKFANEDLQYDAKLGANYMGSLTVQAGEDPAAEIFSDTRAAGYYMDAEPIAVDETTSVNLLDHSYTFTEADHYGFTMIYRIEGVTEPLQLGNWYLSFTNNGSGYASAHTTYGLNTMNLQITEDGLYALHVPFYATVFNFPEVAVQDSFTLTAFSFNDSRNYWSADTYTALNGNTDVKITPVAFLEGAPSGYEVTFHLPEGDKTYSGTYELTDVKKQSITNIPAVTALSLLDTEVAEQYTDENGIVYRFSGFTTKKGDASCLIEENFAAAGTIELYPYYAPDTAATDCNEICVPLVNGADAQGVRYLLDERTLTATVGDGSAWENNSGFSGTGDLLLPAFVVQDGKVYTVNAIGANAFGSNVNVESVTVPNTVLAIGENAFYENVVLHIYESGIPSENSAYDAYTQVLMTERALCGDVNADGTVSLLDAVLLKRWMLGEDVAIAAEEADVDANNKINVFDLALLKRMLMLFPFENHEGIS